MKTEVLEELALWAESVQEQSWAQDIRDREVSEVVLRDEGAVDSESFLRWQDKEWERRNL
jgi:hypothetical protein